MLKVILKIKKVMFMLIKILFWLSIVPLVYALICIFLELGWHYGSLEAEAPSEFPWRNIILFIVNSIISLIFYLLL